MDTLQGDIDALEREKTELRERVKELSRKTLMEGIVRQSSAGMTAAVVVTIIGVIICIIGLHTCTRAVVIDVGCCCAYCM